MATIYLSLSTKADANPQKEIRIRFKHGKIDQQAKTNIFIPADFWDDKAQQIISPNFRVLTDDKKELLKFLSDQRDKLKALSSNIISSFNAFDKNTIASDWLKSTIDIFNFPEKYAPIQPPIVNQSFFDAFDEFLQKRKLSDVRERGFMVLKRAMQRYESIRGFQWQLDSITSDTIKDFESFLLDEHSIYEMYKHVYDKFPAKTGSNRKTSKPQQRGMNYINGLFKRLRAFFNWCNDVEKTTNRPFKNYEGAPDQYGTPFFVTIDERNTIFNTDLSHRPSLAIQRDIFIFQCMTGPRINDFFKMTKHNIINGAIEYIPRKTKDGRPITVRVPLNDTAKMILKRYDSDDSRLLPFISEQKYNVAIKEIFKIAGITRSVTVINPTTREEEKRPINEIASSHLARRSFIANLYKKVKDPNLVGALSGHQEGSKAFARYRDIDEEMKSDLVKLLE